MKFEWDEKKREHNLAKHGIDFLDAALVFDSDHVKLPAKAMATEERFRAIGVAEGHSITVVWTPRDGARRLISAWPSSRKERRAYHEFIKTRKNHPPLT